MVFPGITVVTYVQTVQKQQQVKLLWQHRQGPTVTVLTCTHLTGQADTQVRMLYEAV
jgi:hypothetical protein